MTVSVQIVTDFVNDKMVVPEYKSAGAAGFDLQANITESMYVLNAPVLIPTGLSVAIPEGYELQIRSRSGIAAKNGVFVLNSPGTIDSDYRGGIAVILCVPTNVAFRVMPGDRIAQAVLNRVEYVNWEPVEVLPSTERGSGGFGSTGV